MRHLRSVAPCQSVHRLSRYIREGFEVQSWPGGGTSTVGEGHIVGEQELNVFWRGPPIWKLETSPLTTSCSKPSAFAVRSKTIALELNRDPTFVASRWGCILRSARGVYGGARCYRTSRRYSPRYSDQKFLSTSAPWVSSTKCGRYRSLVSSIPPEAGSV